MGRKVNPCSECGVSPKSGGTYFWRLACPQCGKARVSIVSEAKVTREWNQSNPVRPKVQHKKGNE